MSKTVEELEKEKEAILYLAVQNAEANEFCLKGLEKENEILRKACKKVQENIQQGLDPGITPVDEMSLNKFYKALEILNGLDELLKAVYT